jgi:hypothetical protein
MSTEVSDCYVKTSARVHVYQHNSTREKENENVQGAHAPRCPRCASDRDEPERQWEVRNVTIVIGDGGSRAQTTRHGVRVQDGTHGGGEQMRCESLARELHGVDIFENGSAMDSVGQARMSWTPGIRECILRTRRYRRRQSM